MITREEVAETLRASAMDDVSTGWLSDLEHFDPEFDYDQGKIDVSGPEYGSWGSIDIGQLAGVVLDIIKKEVAP